MTDKEFKAFKDALAEQGRKIKESKEYARQVLINAGVMTKGGKLTGAFKILEKGTA